MQRAWRFCKAIRSSPNLNRDLATARAKIHTLIMEVVALKLRLRSIADCQERRCSLCLTCLHAAFGEDD
jgi:hypothetical protein